MCGEMLWVELLLLINEIFCVLALLESALAVCVAYRGLGTVEEEMAENIDWWAKRIVFPTYLLTLGIVYSLAGARVGVQGKGQISCGGSGFIAGARGQSRIKRCPD